MMSSNVYKEGVPCDSVNNIVKAVLKGIGGIHKTYGHVVKLACARVACECVPVFVLISSGTLPVVPFGV